MSGLVEGVGALLDRRSLASSWVPVLAFLLGMAVVVVGALGPADAVMIWTRLGGPAQAGLAAILVVLTVVLAGLLSASRLSLVRWLEGYLPRGWGWLGRTLRVRHVHIRGALAADDADRRHYPRERGTVEVRPTRIGNIIAAAEEHPQRYGIDAVSTWPRLYPVLPEAFVSAFAAASGSLEAMAALCATGVAFALLGGLAAVFLLPWWGTLLCVLAGLAAAAAARAGAEESARTYAALIRSAYDVHRGLLVDAMGLHRAASFHAERDQWEQWHKVWTTGRPDHGLAGALGYPAHPPSGLTTTPSPDPGSPADPATQAAPATPAPASPAPASPAPTQPVPAPPAPPTVTPPPGPTGRRQRLVLIGVLVLVGVLMAGATEVRSRFLTVLPGHGDELRALHDLRAYVPLTCGDVDDHAGPSSPRDVAGRYPVATIPSGAAVRTDQLGPRLPAGALTGRSVGTVVAAAPTAPGALVRGQQIGVVRVPSDAPRAPTVVGDVVVLDVLAGAPATSLVVAAPPADLVNLAGPGTVVVLATPTAAAPSLPPPPC